jgi:hypothetical protein
VYAWTPNGYQLIERDGEAPAVGATVPTPTGTAVVQRIGPSPLPDDPRPCVFVITEP